MGISRKAALAGFILAAGAGLLAMSLLQSARQSAWAALVATTGWWAKVGPFSYEQEYTDQLGVLLAENARLKAELADYVELRRQLQQPSTKSMRTIEAVVAGAPLDVFRTHVLLNRGARDGVVAGAPVVSEGSVLIGYISELNEQAAVLRLLFDPETSIPAEVAGAPHARGLLIGNLYTSLLLTTVPRDAQINEGQVVVTVAQDITPAALVIGEIEKIYQAENEAYQQARIRVKYDVDDLRAVTVLVQP